MLSLPCMTPQWFRFHIALEICSQFLGHVIVYCNFDRAEISQDNRDSPYVIQLN